MMFAAAAACLALTLAAPAQPAAEELPPAPLSSIGAFYAIKPTEATTARAFTWELDVTYSDPEWNLLWIESDGLGTFIPTNKDFPKFRAGQRVRAEGELVPAYGISLNSARLTVLPEPSRVVPIEATGHLANSASLNDHLVALEAVVDRQSEPDPSHLMLEASAEGFHVVIRIQTPPGTARPALQDCVIRATGVYVAHRDFSGELNSIALWVDSLAGVEVKGTLGTDPAFRRPVVRIDDTANHTSGRPVHIVGTVHSFDSTTATITLRDATGQIDVATAQTRDIRIGSVLEAVGHPTAAGIRRRLLDGRVRPLAEGMGGTPPSADPNQPLRLADQILALEPESADLGRPVQLFGVVTWIAPGQHTLFVQDVSGGIEVRLPATLPPFPHPPYSMIVSGRTARGVFAPIITATSLTWTNPLGWPEPRGASLEEMLSGNLHGRWVATHAYLRGVEKAPQEVHLDLTTTTGELTAVLPGGTELQARPGAIITVRGVCNVVANVRRQLESVQLLVPGADCIEVEDPAPADPFALPARPIAALREFGPTDSSLHRVCTLGTVLYHDPGRYLCLQDKSDSLLVLSRDTEPLHPGDRVEVVGIPGIEGRRQILREAVYRRTGRGSEPEAIRIDRPEEAAGSLDGRLVETRGTVIGLRIQNALCTITLQTARGRFDAHLAIESFEPACCPEHAEVALRGVYQVVYDEYRQPISFSLRLRQAGDITILQPPPLLTVEHVLWILGSVTAFTIGVLTWLGVLRTRVTQQTTQLRTQLEHQARLEAELQKAQRIESLGLLAGGLAHDFNNLLSAILGNLSFNRLGKHPPEVVEASLADAERAALRARELTQRLLVFTKGGNPTLVPVSLPELVRDSARLSGRHTEVRTTFAFAPDLWLANIDRVQIGQVIQNLVLNAAQAMPHGGSLHLTLANERIGDGSPPAHLRPGRYVRITVADTGTGIPAHILPKIFDPYFTTKASGTGLGLASVFAIVRRHGGHIEAESQMDHGTTFRLWLPAADAAQPVEPAGGGSARPATIPPTEPSRVLVVDDDVGIRRMVANTLLYAGYEVGTAAGSREALDLVRSAQANGRPIRLAILDLSVFGNDEAREAATEIRNIDAAIRLVLSTGRTDASTFRDYREHGFDGAIAKPYEAEELVACVKEALESAAAGTTRDGA